MKERSYLRKLRLLRVAFMAALRVAVVATKWVSKHNHYPMMWLLHYISGKGTDMQVPPELVVGATSALHRAMWRDSYGVIPETRTVKDLKGKRFCVCHSTLYEGSGFQGRPTLFYLLGGFTFKVDRVSRKGSMMVSGSDHYDWHGTVGYDGETHYFCSPLGSSSLLKGICRALDKWIGNDLFTDNCWPTLLGEAGISNKLWEEFKKVGAAEFNSYFKAELPLPRGIRKLLRRKSLED